MATLACSGCGRRLAQPGTGRLENPSRWCSRCGGSAGLLEATELRLQVGDPVTTKGRSGAGQPEISGTIESIDGSIAIVRRASGELRARSLRNLRRL